MKRLEKIGNYFVVTESTDGKVHFDHPTKDVVAKFVNGNAIESDKITLEAPTQKKQYPFTAVAATGSVELTGGGAGSVDQITVDSVEIMSGAESFDTDLDTTATAVAANITAHTSTPNYTAVAVGAVVTITAVTAGGGENSNAVVSSTTTITTTDTNMSGGTTSLLKASDAYFDDEAELTTFIRANTGA